MLEPGSLRSWPRLSIVIPSIGRDAVLEDTVRDLDRQSYPDWECIIVLQGDVSSHLPEALKAILGPRLRLYYAREPNASLARNIGLIEATGEVVLFLDDDIKVNNPQFFMMHARHFDDVRTAGVAGQILGPDVSMRSDRHWISKLPKSGWLFFSQTYDKPTRTPCGGSGNLSVRKKFALDVGGMDAQYEKGAHREESDFCLRLTKKYGLLVYDPEASLIHFGEPKGGCRSWGHNSGIHPLHHVCGEWYFILKGLALGTIQWRSLPLHLYVLARRQIFNRQNWTDAKSLAGAISRSYQGYRAARRKMRDGVRDLNKMPGDAYCEIAVGFHQTPEVVMGPDKRVAK